jgi:protoheme IX farnesyltransferase
LSHPAIPADATAPSKKHESRGTFGTYLELTKARLCALVLVTTAVGLWVATPSPSPLLVVLTLLGTGLAAFGANALNQCIEERRDGLMKRTCERPLPSHRLPRLNAWAVSLTLAVAGPVVLWIGVNPLAAMLALLTEVLYLAVYTPLKPRTPLNTLVGAVVGALPPMIGWAAARGQLDLGAWLLALILFLWQIPHFLSLAWLYR